MQSVLFPSHPLHRLLCNTGFNRYFDGSKCPTIVVLSYWKLGVKSEQQCFFNAITGCYSDILNDTTIYFILYVFSCKTFFTIDSLYKLAFFLALLP